MVFENVVWVSKLWLRRELVVWWKFNASGREKQCCGVA